MSGGFEAIPLFSPSQVSRNEEQVLHSIFSPSFGGTRLPVAQFPPSSSDALESINMTAEDSTNHKSPEDCTTKRQGDAKKERAPNRRSQGIPRSVTFCSDALHFKKSSIRESDKRKSPGGGKRSVHFDAMKSPGSLVSPIPVSDDCSQSHTLSIKSSHTNTSWHSIPVEMLDFGFVSNCESERQLEKIVVALTEATPVKYPSLLRMATARLKALRENSTKKNEKGDVMPKLVPCSLGDSHSYTPGTEMSFSPPTVNMSLSSRKEGVSDSERSTEQKSLPYDSVTQTCALGIDRANRQQCGTSCSGLVGTSAIERDEESSLVMNISASMDSERLEVKDIDTFGLHVDLNDQSVKRAVKEPTPKAKKNENECGHVSSHNGERDDKTGQNPSYHELRGNLASVLAAHSSLSAELDNALSERNHLKRELATQTDKCRGLECKIAAQNDALSSKIAALEKARDEAQADVSTLQGTLVSSSEKAREVATKLTARTEEVDRLREELRETKEKATRELVAHQNQHQELTNEIKKLSSQLAIQEEQATKKLELLEKELKRDFEKVSAEQKARIAELTSKLNKARVDIEKLIKKNDELSLSVKQAVPPRGLQNDTLQRRFDQLSEQAQFSEHAATAMAEALALSESELATAVARRTECEHKCSELIEANSCLKVENEELSGRVNRVSQELASSDVYVDKLVDQLEALKEEGSDEVRKMKEEMLHKEKAYRSHVHQLRSRIKGQESWISMEIYKKVVDEAKAHASSMELEVKQLSKRNQELEQMVEKKAEQLRLLKNTSALECIPHATKAVREPTPNGGRDSLFSKEASKKSLFNLPHKAVDKKGALPKKVTPLDSHITGKSLARMSAVRAAGGRAGLTAKLKKTRGSVLRITQPTQAVQPDTDQHGGKTHVSKVPWCATTVQEKENLQFYR